MVWRIGEAVRRAGVTVHALRHYEELGLMRPRRSPSGQRLYGEEDVARVRFVRRAAALGFSLGEIAEIPRLRDGGQAPCGWVRERLGEKVTAIEARIAELDRLRAELLALRDGSPEHAAAACCPVLERGGRRVDMERARTLLRAAWR